jgi:lia operon protein LiaG
MSDFKFAAAPVRALVVAALLLSSVAQAQSSDRITLKGRSVALYNLVGRLNVTGGGSSVTATVTRRGKDAGRLSVETHSIGGYEALVVKYPGDRVTIPGNRNRRSRTELRVREDGSFGNIYSASGRRSSGYNDGRRVRISDEGGGVEAAADIDVQIPTGTAVRLHLAVGSVDVRNVDGDIAVDASGAEIVVSDVKGKLLLDTGSGDASLTNISGSISLDTGSGEVTAKNLSGDVLNIDSGSGGVTVDGCRCSAVTIETGSGNLRVMDMTARTLSLDTGSGDVVLGMRNSPETITIDSGSGDVTMTLPSDFSATVAIDTGSGEISSDFPITLTSKSRDEMRGRIGRGDARLRIDTGSGDVRLRKAN